jgi:hypothetical protein
MDCYLYTASNNRQRTSLTQMLTLLCCVEFAGDLVTDIRGCSFPVECLFELGQGGKSRSQEKPPRLASLLKCLVMSASTLKLKLK